MAHNTRTLAQIVQKIKALEKGNAERERRTIGDVIEIGELLQEISVGELVPQGKYMDWVKENFPNWSHQTSANYRNVYNLARKCKHLDFTKLNISLNALYLVANMDDDEKVARDAILKAATKTRVTFTIAKSMARFARSPPLPPTPRPIKPLK
jgi:hypothetical protein